MRMPKPASKPGPILPSRADDALRHALELAGCRWTRQRAAVYAYLDSVVDHPTTEEIFKAVQRRLPGISLATVYNALDALVKARLATRLTYGDGSSRYDCRAEDHYHLRDVETGEVRDLPASFDPTLLDKLDPQLKAELSRRGFEVTGYRLVVLGRFARS
jgi:Fur family peroxide stress response transcriptional regulator